VNRHTWMGSQRNVTFVRTRAYGGAICSECSPLSRPFGVANPAEGPSRADSLTQESNAGHIGAFPSRKVDLHPGTKKVASARRA
jgi:hypothetical protein